MKRLFRYMTLCLLISVLFLTGCQGEQGSAAAGTAPEGSVFVYYVNSSQTAVLSTVYAMSSTGDAAIGELFEILKNGQYMDGQAAVPAGVVLDQSAWQENSLVLYLTGEYPAADSVQELLCRYAICRTMFQLPDVKGVTIYLDGAPLVNSHGVEIGTMTNGSFLEDVSVIDNAPEQVEAVLYYSNETGDRLVPCTESLVSNSAESLEKQVIQKLIQGPGTDGCRAAVSSDTKLLSVNVKDQICYVNLTEEFLQRADDVQDYIPVYALVNSLTELENVDAVQLMISGSTDINYSDTISFAAPLACNMDYVETGS